MTPSIANTIRNGIWPSEHHRRIAKLLKLYYELAESHGLIEIRDPKEIMSSELSITVDKQVHEDRQILATSYPEKIEIGDNDALPGEIRIGQDHYCGPWVRSLYFSLALSSIWETRILLDRRSSIYLSHRFGNKITHLISAGAETEGFAEVVKQRLPEIDIIPSVTKYQKCNVCKMLKECEPKELQHTEKVIQDYLRWRNYDEIVEMKKTYDEIASQVKSLPIEAGTNQIVKEFQKKEAAISRKINGMFPKIERWSNLITICSIPLMVAGVNAGSSLLTGLGAATTGIAQVGKQYVELLKSKYRWICFRQM